jgi:hypothetical protein
MPTRFDINRASFHRLAKRRLGRSPIAALHRIQAFLRELPRLGNVFGNGAFAAERFATARGQRDKQEQCPMRAVRSPIAIGNALAPVVTPNRHGFEMRNAREISGEW